MMKYQPNCTLIEFEARLRKAIPLLEVWHATNNLPKVERILHKLLQDPLKFPQGADVPPDALWWFRGGSSLPLTGYEYTQNKVLLLKSGSGVEELAVEGLVAYRSPGLPDLAFVYLLAKGLKPVFSAGDGRKEWGCYVINEARYINHGEEDFLPSGSTYETRTRHLAPYNLFIAGKESRLNNTGGKYGLILEDVCEHLLAGNLSLSNFVEVLTKLPFCGFYQHLLDSQ